jgi:hypothetical protein
LDDERRQVEQLGICIERDVALCRLCGVLQTGDFLKAFSDYGGTKTINLVSFAPAFFFVCEVILWNRKC